MSWRLLENLSTADCLLGLAVTATTVAILYKSRQAALTSKDGTPLPPGPHARWFWESVLPTVNVSRTLAGLVSEYGPVVTLRQGSQVTIVIGRVDAAAEIMEKEGAALVDRPRAIAAGEIQGQNLRFVFLRSGERLRRYRKAAHTHLQPKATIAYQDMQMEGARNVIMDILNDPKNHEIHARRYAASVMLRMTYGKSTPTSNDDPEVIRVRQSNKNFLVWARPGAFLVDQIPLLKYIPGYGRRLKEYRDFDFQLYKDQVSRVETDMETNKSGNSFVRTLLENVDEHRLSKDEMRYVAGELFGAGADTTAVAITWMILAAACHPEAQRRVQEELDMVIGKDGDRMPTWEDSKSLPQVHAFVSETLRWKPIAPIGFAHRATRDIIWRGQWIPAGATVLGCHWAICRDPVAFPEPDKFDPQRWIDGNGQLRNDMTAYPYGFGRRACPGQYLANKSLYINLALLLWSFRIVERPDTPIDKNAFTDGVVSHAPPFEVDFVPRIENGQLKQMMAEPVL